MSCCYSCYDFTPDFFFLNCYTEPEQGHRMSIKYLNEVVFVNKFIFIQTISLSHRPVYCFHQQYDTLQSLQLVRFLCPTLETNLVMFKSTIWPCFIWLVFSQENPNCSVISPSPLRLISNRPILVQALSSAQSYPKANH